MNIRYIAALPPATLRRGTVRTQHIADQLGQPLCGAQLRDPWPVDQKAYRRQHLTCQRCERLAPITD